MSAVTEQSQSRDSDSMLCSQTVISVCQAGNDSTRINESVFPSQSDQSLANPSSVRGKQRENEWEDFDDDEVLSMDSAVDNSESRSMKKGGTKIRKMNSRSESENKGSMKGRKSERKDDKKGPTTRQMLQMKQSMQEWVNTGSDDQCFDEDEEEEEVSTWR